MPNSARLDHLYKVICPGFFYLVTMSKVRPLTDKQLKFVEAYSGNATQAARDAGYSKPGVQGPRLLDHPHVYEAIRARDKEDRDGRVMTRRERQEFWTRVIRGEETEVVVTKDDEVDVQGVDVDVKIDWYYGLYLLPKYRINQFQIYGIAGFTKAEGEEVEESDFSYGAGLEWFVSENVSLNVEYTMLFDKSDYEIDSFNIGVNCHF